jgi:hypothetical protein
MPDRVAIKAASGPHQLSLAASDWHVAGAFHNNEFYRSICFARTGPVEVERETLISHVKELLGRIRADWSVLPYHYTFECRISGRDDLLTRGGGGASGFRIDGEIHSIQGGACQCYLEHLRVGPDGKGHVVARIDVRDRATVETDDWGPIRIFRRKLKTTIPEQLEGLLSFLRGAQDGTIRIQLGEGTRSVRELVRLAAEGDEGAEEELFERGATAQAELLDMLSSGKPRNRQGTAAWLLMTIFPSAESRVAVERAAERETDERRRKELLIVLGAVPGPL